MSIKSSGTQLADQVIAYNNNLIDILSKIHNMMESTDSYVTVNVTDTSGIANSFNIPSFGYIDSELKRLNNNILSMFNINDSGALVKVDGSNFYKKVVTVDLNSEPADVTQIALLNSFQSKNNWFYDRLIDPTTFIEVDLSGQIDDQTQRCLVRRYIVEFAVTPDGVYTDQGQASLASFNNLYRNNNNINIDDFINWHKTNNGVIDPLFPQFEEDMYNIESNTLKYDGVFSVLKIDEDTVNRKLWYVLNTLQYFDTETKEVKQLSINDELIINMQNSSTRYRVSDVMTSSASPKIVVERIEGNVPIPVGTATLKIYSPVLYTKKLRIGVGYNERCVVFVKPSNVNNNLLSKNWSQGVGFWTNDLKLVSSDDTNGMSMEQYYVQYVNDYGAVLKDLVARKTPNKLAGAPNVPILDSNNFAVVQINKHLTDNSDSDKLSDLYNQQTKLKSEIDQLNVAIDNKNKQLRTIRFSSDAAKEQFNNELNKLSLKKEASSKLLQSVVSDIMEISKTSTVLGVEPKYRVRGFWNIPDAVVTKSTYPQEVVQFKIQYRYLSKDGKESPVETFNLPKDNSGNTTKTVTAAFSNWTDMLTDARNRVFNQETNQFEWQVQDVSSADTPKINQLDIPIQANEIVEIRIKSISEVGWPDAPVESDWSDPIQVVFPDDLVNVLSDANFIFSEASKEDLRVNIYNDLSARGLDTILDQKTVVNNKTYLFGTDVIISGFKDVNGNMIDLYDLLATMQNKIISLEEVIKRSRGQLQVIIFRGPEQYEITNGSTKVFTVECEDYLEKYTADGVPTGRVYANNIYLINDFMVKIKNSSIDSPLGLLSNRLYNSTSNGDVYNQSSPQVFWVNDQHELQFSNLTGTTMTQIDNQYVWSCNYNGVNQNAAIKLANNIGNNFANNGNNSITDVLSSNEYNIGFFENSTLAFANNNNSLMDSSKWIDVNSTTSSTNKLLTTIHPTVDNLNNITEKNAEKVKTINPVSSDDINIPINIYFKMNALDSSKPGVDYTFINLNNTNSTVQHNKKIKILLEKESDNRPFSFVIEFRINRSRVVTRKVLTPLIVSTFDRNQLSQLTITKA